MCSGLVRMVAVGAKVYPPVHFQDPTIKVNLHPQFRLPNHAALLVDTGEEGHNFN